MKIGNGKVFTENGFVENLGIEFTDTIKAIGDINSDLDFDAKGGYIIPGLIDIHTHGALGEDTSDGIVEALPKMSRYYAKGGVTSWCPTTMTLPEDVLAQAMGVVRDFKRPSDGAKALGIHMEGPFLSQAKKGAQAGSHIINPDIEMFKRLYKVSGDNIRLITMAPESEGSIEFIKEVSKLCTVSVGHTTADYDTAIAAFKAGASHITHMFNGMPSLLHREPGVIGAAYDMGVSAELICDGYHIHPSVVRISRALFGDRLVFISDSLRCAGMPDGDYTLGGQPITMKGGKATLKDTDTLAGSSIHLIEGVRRAVKFGISLEDAIYSATTAPAKAIGLENKIGALKVGLSSDIVVLDENLEVKAVFIDGKIIE